MGEKGIGGSALGESVSRIQDATESSAARVGRSVADIAPANPPSDATKAAGTALHGVAGVVRKQATDSESPAADEL